MKPLKNGSTSRGDELEHATKKAQEAMLDARIALSRLLEELNKPSPLPVRVGRGETSDGSVG